MTQQLVLQPDPAAGVDAHISSGSYANVNQGSSTAALIGTSLFGKGLLRHRYLLRFDLASLPAGAAIVDAALALTTVASTGAVGAQFHTYRLTRADWTELGATWNVYDGVNAWQAAGGDFSATGADSLALPAADANLVFSGLTELACDALESRDGKLELIVVGPESSETSYLTINTSDETAPSFRPQLVINYVPAPTLTVSDHGDGSGATATISGVDSSGTSQILVRSFEGQLGAGAWGIAGMIAGSGSMALTLPAGHYFACAVARAGGVQLPSQVVYFVASDGLESIHTRCLAAVQARIRLLGLAGVESGRVIVERLPMRRQPSVADQLPAIVISPERSSMPPAEGTNGADDVHYAMLVAIFDRDNQQSANAGNLDRHLLWRQQIARAFRNQRLPGVPEVINAEVEPAEGLLDEAWKRELMASALRLRFTSRETRGF